MVTESRIADPRFKIDHAPQNSPWLYGLYVRRKFLGLIPYWHCLDTSDSVHSLRCEMETMRQLPRYRD